MRVNYHPELENTNALNFNVFEFYFYFCPIPIQDRFRGENEYYVVPCFLTKINKKTADICYIGINGFTQKRTHIHLLKEGFDEWNDETISRYFNEEIKSIREYKKFFEKGVQDKNLHHSNIGHQYNSPAREMYEIGYKK